MFINSPGNFAVWFNEKYPGAYRAITAEDVRDMTACGLIGRYRWYSTSQDGETVRALLEYEQMREKRSAQNAVHDKQESPSCRMCGQLLPIESDNKIGRPRVYCSTCETLRNRERQKMLRHRRSDKSRAPTVT